MTFLLLKDQVIDDAAHNKYLPPAGSGSNQKGLPPAELHTAAITQLLYAPAMFKDKYLTLSKDNTLKLWRTRTLQHMRTARSLVITPTLQHMRTVPLGEGWG